MYPTGVDHSGESMLTSMCVVWAKKEIEKEKVFIGMHDMMEKLDDGKATVAEAKAYLKASDENLFAVGRRGRI